MPANFPDSPTVNQEYTYSGSTWVWTGQYWRVQQAPSTNNNFIPAANVAYDLGSANQRWRDLYLSGNSLIIGGATLTATGSAIALPAGSTVGGQNVASGSDVATSSGPKITNVQVTSNSYVVLDDTAVDIAGGYIKITGTNFVTGCQVLINNTPATSTTFVSATEVRAQVPATAAGSYIIYLVNPDGGVAIRINGITFSATPTWVTGSSLAGNVDEAISIQLSATGATSYVLAVGSTLPTGLTLSSGGLLSGTVTGLANDTSYSFTITAVDAENQDSPRSFTITISANLQVARSLSFNSQDNIYLQRTVSVAGNRRLWTWSCWVKLGPYVLTGSNYRVLFEAYTGATDTYHSIAFNGQQIAVQSDFNNGGGGGAARTTPVYRDPSAWYHITVTYDNAQSVAADRCKIYINGSLQTLAVATVTQNFDNLINSANAHRIGNRWVLGTSNALDGNMTEIYFVDGQALNPTSFAKTDLTSGQWTPKRYTGTYGTNGFYLNFSDNSGVTATTLGKDSSGNNNNFTPNSFRLSQSSVYWSRYFTYGNGSGIVPNARIFDGTTTNGGANLNGVTQNFVPPTPISYNTLEVLFGNGNNIGSPGAPLSLNGVVVQSAPAGSGGALSTYTTNTPGTLTSLSVGGGISGQYESNIYKIKIDGRYLTDPIYSASSIDSPTNYGTDSGLGGEVRGNYCTFNPALPAFSGIISLSNGSLDASTTTGTTTGQSTYGTFVVNSGKWYWEATFSQSGSPNFEVHIGWATSAVDNSNAAYGYLRGGQKVTLGTAAAYGSSYTNGDVIGIALDLDAGTMVFYKNGVSQGTAFTGLSGTLIPTARIIREPSYTSSWVANFGQRPFAYAAPSGFKSLNTHNLPALAVAKSNTVFDTVLYTGDGAASKSITGLAFQPDLVWIKSRSNASGFHVISDSVRGAGNWLTSNATNVEAGPGQLITAFNADGFSLNLTPNNTVNESGGTYVAWAWDAGTATVVNTAGTIQSNVRVNTAAGISIVSYTGTQATATVGHGLGTAPKLILAKSRSVTNTNWVVYHSSLGSTSSVLVLNSSNAPVTITNYWSSAVPTSTVFGVANGVYDNNNGSMIAYCFAEVQGFSSFGGWTGNGSADGPFIYTGFRPAMIIAKQTNTSGQNWYILDSDRSPSNVLNSRLYPNLTNSEDSDGNINCDLLSNGFKIRDAYIGWNASGGTYIYAAFAESPFKNARAR